MKHKLHRLAVCTAFALIVGASAAHAQSSMTMDEDMRMAKEFMQTAQAFVQSAVGNSGNVSVTVDGDTAVLVGFVDNTSVKRMAERAALMDLRVENVRSHLIVS